MSNKKNLPNIPIYIGDWERDCNVLSLESEAAWMRIVFKLWTKGKQNSIKIPTKSLQNLWRCSEQKMNEILQDLIYNEIAEIAVSVEFIEFTCRRFVKENSLSEIRSNAAKSIPFKKNTKANIKQKLNKKEQNTDNEIDYENEVDIKNKIEVIKKEKIDFEKIFSDFNFFCNELPQVKEFSESRKKAIAARIKKYGVEDVYKVFKLTSESDFLTGKKTDFKASFDWIMNPTNFIKILEGNYKNIENHGKERGNNTPKSDIEHKQDAINAVNAMFGIK